MIVPCRACGGTGQARTIMAIGVHKCEGCNGAGEIEINIPEEKLVSCKTCKGLGIVSGGLKNCCPACRGTGLVERPSIGTKKQPVILKEGKSLDNDFEFDIAVSFAGENRKIVQEYCDIITKKPSLCDGRA